MSDLLKGIEEIAKDPFKAGSGFVKDKIFGKDGADGPFGQKNGTNPGINDFKAALLSSGLQRTNRFLFVPKFPSGIFSENEAVELQRFSSMKAIAATVPTKSVSQKEMLGFGQPYKVGDAFEFGEFSVTFILSRDHKELKIFNTWMNQIYSNKNGTVGYYKDYISELRLYPLDQRDNQSYVYIFESAYPTSVDVSDFSSEEENGFSTITVGFSFRRFLGDNQEIPGDIAEKESFLGNVSDGLKQASSLIGAVDNGLSKLESLKNKFK